jgi:hypothetical protein
MKRERKSATILKPEIDEEAALRFAAAVAPPTSSNTSSRSPKPGKKPSTKALSVEKPKEMCQISLTVKKSLYDKIAKDAARKNRTVEEHLRKHLTKRYAK